MKSDIRTYDYLDACRGYAILLVMLAHTMGAFPGMPWHVTRFSDLGWNGVQLFFVVSSLTLAMSWRRRSVKDPSPYLAFLVRRVFRIAPMFYLAFLFYYFYAPPGLSFRWVTVATTLTFQHGWNPLTLSTVRGGWTAVPGSWSIAVEFGFYLLFPVFVFLLTTLDRALLAIPVTLVFAAAADRLGMWGYIGAYGWKAADQFVFYWLPNQIPVFCLGFVALHLLDRCRDRRLDSIGPALCAVLAMAFFGLSYIGFARTPRLVFPFIPIHVAASVLFCGFVVILGLSGRNIWINRPAVALGKVSFSAYLLHFAIIAALSHVFGSGARGWTAIGEGGAMFAAVVVATYLLSSVTYLGIERPMIAAGRVMAERIAHGRERAAARRKAAMTTDS